MTEVDPSDLVPLAVAARMADRSPSTLRRWLADGDLRRFERAPPARGGLPRVLVSKRGLLAYLATAGVEPRSPEVASAPADGRSPRLAGAPAELAGATLEVDDLAGEVVRLRHELAMSEARTAVALAEAEVATLRERLDETRAAAAREVVALREAAAGEALALRELADGWRARAVAAEAEVAALRTRHGLPWWRRLLGGPVPELPEG